MKGVKSSILEFPRQLEYQPLIENGEKLAKRERFILIGMGGSRLAADLARAADPNLDLAVHSDYGLPRFPERVLRQSLLVFCSYSGTTEEVLDSLEQALVSGYAVAVITTGGQLLARARTQILPHVCLPTGQTGLPDLLLVPRLAVGLMLKALAAFLYEGRLDQHFTSLASKLDPSALEHQGRELVQTLADRLPIIYTSAANAPLAWIWKIKFNETAKVPAFANVLPEQNHNELEGLASNFSFIFLTDPSDDPRIKHRFQILGEILGKKGLPVTVLELTGATQWEKFFNSLTLSDWTTLALAEHYGRDPASVPLIEEFKKLMATPS